MNRAKTLTALLISYFTLSAPCRAVASNKLYVLVSGARTNQFACKLEPASNPPVIANELMRLKVKVAGGTGPFQWRLPLYQKNQYNGYNDMAVARVGNATPDEKHEFYIDLNASDLERATSDKLTLTLFGRDTRQVSCSTPATKLRQLALNRPPIRLNIVEGRLVR